MRLSIRGVGMQHLRMTPVYSILIVALPEEHRDIWIAYMVHIGHEEPGLLPAVHLVSTSHHYLCDISPTEVGSDAELKVGVLLGA